MKIECPHNCGVTIIFPPSNKPELNDMVSFTCPNCKKVFYMLGNKALRFESLLLKIDNPSSRRFG